MSEINNNNDHIALMNHTMLLKFSFLMKTKQVSDETSSIVSCTMRNKMKLCNNWGEKVRY